MAETFARRRLLHDLAEVLREPSPLVAAVPLDDNIFEWHANLCPNEGPLVGVIFHVRITFPSNYPDSPPNLFFPMKEIPSFKHPNLYSFGLCLDILSSFIGQEDKNAGWSPAYTVRTLLMQLQSFLFEFDAAPQDHGGTYQCRNIYDKNRILKVRREASDLVCKQCGHCARKPLPALQQARSPASQLQPSIDRVFSNLKELRIVLTNARARLSELYNAQPSVVHAVSSVGLATIRASNSVGHLHTDVGADLAVRVIAVGQNGGLRLGLGASGCNGLVNSNGCVAWDSVGKLVLGQVVRSGAMPVIQAGDVVSVALPRNGPLLFQLNGKTVAHDPCATWPQVRSLERFLCNEEGKPAVRCGSAVNHKHVQAWVSFRNASIEVLNGVELHDHALRKAATQRVALEGEISKLECKQANLIQVMQENKEQALRIRTQCMANVKWAGQIPVDLMLKAFMDVDVEDVPALMRVCSGWRQVVVERGLLERLQICCFYTKATPAHDVLGFGVSAVYHQDGNLKELSTELDTISLMAFSEFNLRRGAWGENFEYFLPMVLDGNHMHRVLPVLESSIALLATGSQRKDDSNAHRCMRSFEPWMALAVLPQLMNSFAVSLMNTNGEVTRHASEKALLGYCSFHHMLLAISAKYPSLEQVATNKLRNFMRSERGRHKSETPDLGQLLVYCVVSTKIRWQDIALAVVEESGVRSILWLLRKSPRLETPGISNKALLSESFEGRLTGLRLLMFQAFFLCNIGCPDSEGADTALPRYNYQFGLPTQLQKESLFKNAREILAVSTWAGYYARLGLRCPGREELADNIRQYIFASTCCGYHTPSSRGSRGAPGGKSRRNRESVVALPQKAWVNTERVGVQQDLRRAFASTKACNMTQPASGKPNKKKSATEAKKLAVNPVQVQNKFAGLVNDSDEE